jgi:hypothetical protein
VSKKFLYNDIDIHNKEFERIIGILIENEELKKLVDKYEKDVTKYYKKKKELIYLTPLIVYMIK